MSNLPIPNDPLKGDCVTPPLVWKPRLQAYLTADGITPIGDSRQVILKPAEASYTLGGPADTWGAALSPATLNSSGFGVLLRRADSNTDEAVDTARFVEYVSVVVTYNPFAGSLIMPERNSEIQVNIIGKEVTRGTAVNPSIRLRSFKAAPQPNNEMKEYRAQGDLLPVGFDVVATASEASVDGYPTYDEIGYLLAGIVGKPVTELVSTGVYRHTFNLNVRGAADIQTYTIEYGDANAAERVAYAVLAELGLTFNRKDPKLSGKFIGRGIEERTAITPGANCQQVLTMGTATSFKLRYNGATTAALTTAGLTAAAIQTALTGLSTVGFGNMTVSGTGPYTITAASALAGQRLPLIEVVDATGGTAPTVAYATNGQGGYTELAAVPAVGEQVSLYYADSLATLAGGKLTKCFGGELSISNRFAPYWVMDDTQDSWSGVTEQAMNFSTKFTVQADSVAKGMASDCKAKTRKCMRLEFVGPEIVSGTNHKMTFDMSGYVSLIDNFRDEETIYAREFGFEAVYDPAWGRAVQITLLNGVASY